MTKAAIQSPSAATASTSSAGRNRVRIESIIAGKAASAASGATAHSGPSISSISIEREQLRRTSGTERRSRRSANMPRLAASVGQRDADQRERRREQEEDASRRATRALSAAPKIRISNHAAARIRSRTSLAAERPDAAIAASSRHRWRGRRRADRRARNRRRGTSPRPR